MRVEEDRLALRFQLMDDIPHVAPALTDQAPKSAHRESRGRDRFKIAWARPTRCCIPLENSRIFDLRRAVRPNHLQHFSDAPAAQVGRHAVQFAMQVQELLRRQKLVELELLRQEAELAPGAQVADRTAQKHAPTR